MSLIEKEIPPVIAKPHCYHCGDPCEADRIVSDEKDFCCQGCKTVYEILSENQLCTYYDLENSPGLTQKNTERTSTYDFLDNESIFVSQFYPLEESLYFHDWCNPLDWL